MLQLSLGKYDICSRHCFEMFFSFRIKYLELYVFFRRDPTLCDKFAGLALGQTVLSRHGGEGMQNIYQ
jgi:hypothetical protein